MLEVTGGSMSTTFKATDKDFPAIYTASDLMAANADTAEKLEAEGAAAFEPLKVWVVGSREASLSVCVCVCVCVFGGGAAIVYCVCLPRCWTHPGRGIFPLSPPSSPLQFPHTPTHPHHAHATPPTPPQMSGEYAATLGTQWWWVMWKFALIYWRTPEYK
jgi:hypothetical protein